MNRSKQSGDSNSGEMGLCGTPLNKPGGAAKGKLLGGRGTGQLVSGPDLLREASAPRPPSSLTHPPAHTHWQLCTTVAGAWPLEAADNSGGGPLGKGAGRGSGFWVLGGPSPSTPALYPGHRHWPAIGQPSASPPVRATPTLIGHHRLTRYPLREQPKAKKSSFVAAHFRLPRQIVTSPANSRPTTLLATLATRQLHQTHPDCKATLSGSVFFSSF